jgi:hypothetical protein
MVFGRDSVSGVAGDLDNRTAIHDAPQSMQTAAAPSPSAPNATHARQILDAPWCPAVTHASTDTQPNADKGDKHDLAAR